MWDSIPKVAGSIPTVTTVHIFQACPGISFKPARCGYTLRVTSQASYSPEYTTPTQWISVLVLQSNPVFRCGQHCNIVMQYCNIDQLIALANCTDANKSQCLHTVTLTKQSTAKF
jgi:hypothetical protein